MSFFKGPAARFGLCLLFLLSAACGHVRPLAKRPPRNHDVPQVCRVRHKDGAQVILTMQLSPRPKLFRECQRVADYLALPKGPLPPFAVTEAERALERLGYFKTIHCALNTPEALSCELTHVPIVRSFKVSGRLPMALLQEDIRRRISLRPGVLLTDMAQDLHRQSRRLEQYLRGEGFFDSAVAITPVPMDGQGLNQDIHLMIDVSAHETAQVRRIQFEGNPTIATDKLAWPFWQRGFLGRHRAFHPSRLSQNVETATQMLRDQGYVGAHLQASYAHYPEAEAVDVTVRVSPGRRVQLRFLGNTAFSERRLRRLAPFAATGAADAVAVEQMRQSIERLYQEKGYAEVDVQASIGTASAHTVEVTYVIEASERYHVTQVKFVGASTLKPTQLLAEGKLLQRASSRFLHRPWVDAFVQHDESYLAAALRAQGYVDAQVRAHKQAGAQPNTLVLCYAIDAGMGHRVQSVSIVGAPDETDSGFDAKKMLRRLKMQQGGPLWPGGTDSDQADLEGKLASLGFIGAHVSVTLEAADGTRYDSEQALLEAQQHVGQQHAVRITYNLTPGARARLGGIFIHGNFRTRSGTLLQEMNARVGKPINLSALGAARRALRNLNLFDAVQLTPAHSSLGSDHTWLILAVQERSVRQLEAVGAFSSDYRFSLGADFKDANVFGRAMLLTLTARLGNAKNLLWHPLRIGDQDLLEARLRAPHPFGLPLTAEASTTYRYRDVQSYRDRNLTGQAAIIKQLLYRSRCRYCPDVVGRLAYELTEGYFFDKNDSVVSGKSTTIARIIPKVTVSNKDSAIDPRRGASLDVAFEVAHPIFAGYLGDRASAFWRLLVGAQTFVPLGPPIRVQASRKWTLGGPLVLALASNVSWAEPYGPRGGVPTLATFGYGGDLSVRGLGNRASTAQIEEAHAMFTASAEVRWYVLEHLGPGDVQLAGFVDSGTVAASASELYQQHTLSAGPALRYVTPFGPVSVAYGRALIKPYALLTRPDVAPRRGRLHVTFGYAF